MYKCERCGSVFVTCPDKCPNCGYSGDEIVKVYPVVAGGEHKLRTYGVVTMTSAPTTSVHPTWSYIDPED